MLSTADKEKLKSLGFDVDGLVSAITNEQEVAITIPEGRLFKDAEIEELKNNVKTSHEKDYSEIYLRKLNKEHDLGLSSSEAKDEKRVLQAMKEKAVKDAGIAPNDRIKDLEASIKKLQDEVIPSEQRKAKQWEDKYKEREVFDMYAGLIPKGATSILTQAEHVNRIKGMFKHNEDGTWTDIKTGAILKDNLEKPITDIAPKIMEVYKSNEGWLQDATPKAPIFHHSTQGGGAGTPKFDHVKTFEQISAQYDMTTLEGRQQAQAAFTVAQVNAAKAN